MKIKEDSEYNLNLDALNDLYNKTIEINKKSDFEMQLATSIPAPFSEFYRFVTNPSTVNVRTFKKMLDTDDTINSGINLLCACLCARLGDYQHPSEEITKFVNQMIGKLKGGFEASVKKMLSATWAGFSVNEMVFAYDGENYFVEKFVPLTPDTVMFEVDRFGEVTENGIIQYQKLPQSSNLNNTMGFNAMGGQSYNGFSPSPDYLAAAGDYMWPIRVSTFLNYYIMRIPKKKCILYSFDLQGQFENPYGRSILRSIYNWWVNKYFILKSLVTALDRKATPLTIVYSQQYAGSVLTDMDNFNGNGAAPNSFGMRADDAVKEIFKDIHTDTVVHLPGMKGQIYDVETIQQGSNSTEFIQSLDFCNKSIMRGLLIPSLLMTNGDGTGSYSLGQEHVRTFEKILDGMLLGLKNALIEQYIKTMLLLNFDEDLFKKDGFGQFTKRQITGEERKSEIDLIEKLSNIGAVNLNDLNDLNKVREMAGFEKLDKVPEKAEEFEEISDDGYGIDKDEKE